MRIVVLLAATLIAIGCKKEEAPEAAAEPTVTAEMPDTPEARAFARRLVSTPLTSRTVLSSGGGTFAYTGMTFRPDGTWTADGELEAGDETLACTEYGQWEIESAPSRTTATMSWSRLKTSCPGREAQGEQRVELTLLEDGAYKMAFR